MNKVKCADQSSDGKSQQKSSTRVILLCTSVRANTGALSIPLLLQFDGTAALPQPER